MKIAVMVRHARNSPWLSNGTLRVTASMIAPTTTPVIATITRPRGVRRNR